MLRPLRAQHVLVVLDASFDAIPGSFAGATTEQQFMSHLTRAGGRAVIAASSENEPALELAGLKHGLFTHYLLRGLAGEAAGERDGTVTAAELMDYLGRAVPEHAHTLGTRQRPVLHGDLADIPALVEARPAR